MDNAAYQLWMREWHIPMVSAGGGHTLLLRSDGSAVAIGCNNFGQRNISLSGPGICYIGDMTFCRDLALQLEVLAKDDADTLILTGSTLVGEERFHLTARGSDPAWETHKRIARELKMHLPKFHLVLPDGQLLAKVCRTNPGASVAQLSQSTQHPQPP